ncbi:hypothetical protein [Caenibacillus caldisaponilyticus]|uniref:hypothetical protein n=1 Tax=Caenibacillus caldisaponilyticus TaxID=1674942 RepID=UPI001178AF1E|nr:hypothetical protein [Caenibacillus caldisaponilyticus]
MVIRNIGFKIDTDSWTCGSTIPFGLRMLPSIIEINLLEVLIHVAKRTSFPISYGFTLSDLWAWLRYFPAFSNDINLRLRAEWDEVDSHQKTILSDDMGMGFSSAILSYCLDLVWICPTSYVVRRHPNISLRRSGKKGPDKSPDFMAVDMFDNIHVFECKGTQSDIKTLDKQLNTGIEQKNNLLDPNGLIDQKLVTGVFIPQYNSNEFALFKIKDPEFSLDFSSVKKDEIIETIILGEIASFLHLLGFPKIANSIAENKKLDIENIEKSQREVNELDTEIINGKKYKIINRIHRIDYPDDFSDQGLYGIKIQMGIRSDFINKLLLYYKSPIEIVREFRFELQNKDLNKNNTKRGKNWASIESPLGTFVKLELI